MKNDLHNLLNDLTKQIKGLEGTVDKAMDSVEEAKKQVSPEIRKDINFFQREMMKSALNGDLKAVTRLRKKMNEKLKNIQDADSNN